MSDTDSKQPIWKSAIIPVAVAALSIGGTLGGMFLQDRFDVLGTQRDLVIQYMDDAETSAESVEAVIADIFDDLSNPDSQLTSERVKNLRKAMLDLRRSSERVAVQSGATEGEFKRYSSSMANLVEIAHRTSGPGDADDLVEAVAVFLASKRRFEEEVASSYGRSSG